MAVTRMADVVLSAEVLVEDLLQSADQVDQLRAKSPLSREENQSADQQPAQANQPAQADQSAQAEQPAQVDQVSQKDLRS